MTAAVARTGRSIYGLWFQGWERRGGVSPTWYLLVWLEVEGAPGRVRRAIGPLTWTSARELAARWEREFGAGTSKITQKPQCQFLRVGPARRPRSSTSGTDPTPGETLPQGDPDDAAEPDDPEDEDRGRAREET